MKSLVYGLMETYGLDGLDGFQGFEMGTAYLLMTSAEPAVPPQVCIVSEFSGCSRVLLGCILEFWGNLQRHVPQAERI